jgi:hypothetical protein
MTDDVRGELQHSGRVFTEEEVEQICETVALFPNLAIRELASTVSEHLGWYTAGGTVKRDACMKLLVKMENAGLLELSERQKRRGRAQRKTVIEPSEATAPGKRIEASLRELAPVRVEPVIDEQQKALWNEYVQRYHPLGYKKPFGYRLRYFVYSGTQRLGCVLVSGAAKSIGVRDTWIGWEERRRLCNLSWVVGNNRFLIFPWVVVKNLASHVLAQLTARVCRDWRRSWGYEPLLMESFVDPLEHEGSCYKAAGWRLLGMTTGEGLVRPGKHYTTRPKMIFVKPLYSDFRTLLCSSDLHRQSEGETA